FGSSSRFFVVPAGVVTMALFSGCVNASLNGSPGFTTNCAFFSFAGFSQSTALATNIGKETRYGQRLCNVSKPTQMILRRPNSPATIIDACGASTSDTPQFGVFTAKVSATGTLSKLT